MSTSTTPTSTAPERHGFATGVTIVAGVFLIIASILAIFQGISAIAADQLYVVGPEYLYSINLAGWGWIHLILGILGVVIALGMFSRSGWALIAAIIIAALSIIAQFLWLPYYPWWAIIVIVLDIIVIWAASVSHGSA